jgi:hypothetical protein
MSFESAEALPWVFIQETDAGVKRGPSPALQGKKADPVHLFRYGENVGGT